MRWHYSEHLLHEHPSISWATRCGRPCAECPGLRHIERFLLWFRGARTPFFFFLLARCDPGGCRLTTVYHIRAVGEECCFQRESIFPSIRCEKDSGFERGYCFSSRAAIDRLKNNRWCHRPLICKMIQMFKPLTRETRHSYDLALGKTSHDKRALVE